MGVGGGRGEMARWGVGGGEGQRSGRGGGRGLHLASCIFTPGVRQGRIPHTLSLLVLFTADLIPKRCQRRQIEIQGDCPVGGGGEGGRRGRERGVLGGGGAGRGREEGRLYLHTDGRRLLVLDCTRVDSALSPTE